MYRGSVAHAHRRCWLLQERKLRGDELSDVRKLKLQQILQMLTCERDTEQVGLGWSPWVPTPENTYQRAASEIAFLPAQTTHLFAPKQLQK